MKLSIQTISNGVKPVLKISGESTGDWDDLIQRELEPLFHITRDEHRDYTSSPPTDTNRYLPEQEWYVKWTAQNPAVELSISEQSTSAIPTTSPHLVMREGFVGDGQMLFGPDDLFALKEALLQTCNVFYKAKAKRYRKMTGWKAGKFTERFGPLVRYNFKAGLMEELAGDPSAAVKTFHVACSALVEAAKEHKEDRPGFIRSVCHIADVLVVKIVGGLARSGAVQEADAYLRNHHRWAASEPLERIRNFLAVSESFAGSGPPVPYGPAHYYLEAVNVARGLLPDEVPRETLRLMLTRAFDSCKAREATRHLLYISLLSAELFENSQYRTCVVTLFLCFRNLEVLAEKLHEYAWNDLAESILAELPLATMNLSTLWFLMMRSEEVGEDLLEAIEEKEGTVKFDSLEDTQLLHAAFRFTPDGYELRLCNMSPLILNLERVIISLSMAGDEGRLEEQVSDELLPGASLTLKKQASFQTFPVKIMALYIKSLDGKTFAFANPGTLATVDTLYTLPEWNSTFLKGLAPLFWEKTKAKTYAVRAERACDICRHVSTPAVGVPIKVKFNVPEGGECILLGNDHAVTDHTGPIKDIVAVTWPIGGWKTVQYQVRGADSSIANGTYQVHVIDPLEVLLSTRMIGDRHLVMVDVSFQFDEMNLTKWECWDSESGASFTALNSDNQAEGGIGDVYRIGFVVPEASKPVVRLHWSTATASGSILRNSSVERPVADIHIHSRVSAMQCKQNELVFLTWTLHNKAGTDQQLALGIDSMLTDWIFEGPCADEAFLPAGETFTFSTRAIPVAKGTVALPALKLSYPSADAGAPSVTSVHDTHQVLVI